MCYTVCGMVHLKDHMLLFEKTGFPLSLADRLA